jgi:hypothetical protein
VRRKRVNDWLGGIPSFVNVTRFLSLADFPRVFWSGFLSRLYSLLLRLRLRTDEFKRWFVYAIGCNIPLLMVVGCDGGDRRSRLVSHGTKVNKSNVWLQLKFTVSVVMLPCRIGQWWRRTDCNPSDELL